MCPRTHASALFDTEPISARQCVVQLAPGCVPLVVIDVAKIAGGLERAAPVLRRRAALVFPVRRAVG